MTFPTQMSYSLQIVLLHYEKINKSYSLIYCKSIFYLLFNISAIPSLI